MNQKNHLFLILIIAGIVLLSRFLPHTPNFSPLFAVALFTAVYADKKLFFLPFLALFISDIFLGFYTWGVMLSVYLSLAATLGFGLFLKKHHTALNTLSASLASALLFFLVTNFAVWYFGDWYARDFSGLAFSYQLAIPFFKTSVLSNLVYTTILFGTYQLVLEKQKKKNLVLEK